MDADNAGVNGQTPGEVDLGQRIRDLRLKAGLSQAEVAEGMLSSSYLSLVESGQRTPGSAALAHIADQLGTDVGYLTDGINASVRMAARLALSRAEKELRDGDPEVAYQMFADLVDDRGLDDGQARRARLGCALARERSGELDAAVDMLSELVEEARQAPEVQPWIDATEAIMRCFRELGDIDLAVSIGESAIERAGDLRLQGSDEYIRLGTNLLGAYIARGDIGKSRHLSDVLVDMADRSGSPHSRAGVYWNASLVAETRGHLAQAHSLADRALTLYGEGDDARNLARLRIARAWLLLTGLDPQPQDALAMLDEARPQVETHASAVDMLYLDLERARALHMLGRIKEAAAAANGVLDSGDSQPHLLEATARMLLATIHRDLDARDDALVAADLAAAALDRVGVGAARRAATAWMELGGLYRELGRTTSALDAYDRALRLGRLFPPVLPDFVSAERDPGSTT